MINGEATRLERIDETLTSRENESPHASVGLTGRTQVEDEEKLKNLEYEQSFEV